MKTENETGRSMVEMLAVLAIMGILSLGGIAGYTYGTNRYQANRILDVAGKLAGMGVGGTTYSNLKAAGLKLDDFPNVNMELKADGTVCVSGLGDFQETFEAQAMSFKVPSGDYCDDNAIRLDFKK